MATRSANWLAILARSWFPVSLLALLILAVPGLLLFGLHVSWRRRNVQHVVARPFSAHLPHPPLVVAYPHSPARPCGHHFAVLPELKRKKVQVASTFLWRKSIEDLHVNALLQWLRQNLAAALATPGASRLDLLGDGLPGARLLEVKASITSS